MFRVVFFLLILCMPLVAESAPHRLVSLAPSVTELLFSLDCGPRLVGRSHFSTRPSEAQSIPDIGSYIRPSLEKIVMLQPDLCIGIKDGTPGEAVRRLEQLGIPVLILDIDSLENLQTSVQQLGAVLEISESAQRVQNQIQQRLQRASLKVNELSRGKQIPRVLFQLQGRPLIAASSLSFAGKLIELAGACNVVTGAGGVLYPVLGREEAARLQPDVVLVAGMDAEEHGTESVKQWRMTRSPQADRRTFVVDPDLFTRPSLSALDALEALIRMLWEE